MSKYSEKVERRREEEAREAEKAAKAERHAESEAAFASRWVISGVAAALDALDSAVSHGDDMARAAVGGPAKNEAMSIRNSLWATREKLRGLHKRAQGFFASQQEGRAE